jgi:hypothetical protein
MKPRTAKETAMICVAAVLVVTVLTIPFEIVPYGQPANESLHKILKEVE